jgi:membrane-associated phospholipid phosphatase
MPSLHVAWALIVGLILVWTARPLAARLIGLCYPVFMSLAVVITANHYIADCLGAAGVVLIACCLTWLLPRLASRFSHTTRRKGCCDADGHGAW